MPRIAYILIPHGIVPNANCGSVPYACFALGGVHACRDTQCCFSLCSHCQETLFCNLLFLVPKNMDIARILWILICISQQQYIYIYILCKNLKVWFEFCQLFVKHIYIYIYIYLVGLDIYMWFYHKGCAGMSLNMNANRCCPLSYCR